MLERTELTAVQVQMISMVNPDGGGEREEEEEEEEDKPGFCY